MRSSSDTPLPYYRVIMKLPTADINHSWEILKGPAYTGEKIRFMYCGKKIRVKIILWCGKITTWLRKKRCDVKKIILGCEKKKMGEK